MSENSGGEERRGETKDKHPAATALGCGPIFFR